MSATPAADQRSDDERARVASLASALEASERRFRAVIAAIPDLIFRMSADGTFLDYSPASQFDTYVPPEQFVGKKITEVLPAEVAEQCLAAIGRVTRNGEEQTVEYRLPGDGGLHHYEARIAPSGTAELVAIVRDVTERKQAEETATRLGRLLDDSLNEIYIFDAETLRFIQVNRGARENLGFDMGELRQLTPLDLKPEFDPSSFVELLAPLRTGKRSKVQFRTRHRRKDGSCYPVEVHLQQSTFGSLPVFVAIILDTTERDAAEESRRRSEADYRALFEHATYGIYRSRGDRFLTANPALVRMLGYASEREVLALNLSTDVYVDPVQRTKLLEHHRGVVHVQDVEAQWKRKDGSPITVRLNGRAVRGESGALECYEIFAENVSQRLALEAQLLQAQKMEGIGQLTGGIAHDFNNILTVIQANADSVGTLLPNDHPEVHAGVEEIQAATRRGTALVRRLLGFSRQAMLTVRPVDLAELVQDILASLRRLVPERIEIRFTSEERLPPVEADPAAIEQILMNLTTNARDAMPVGGLLHIKLQQATLAESHCEQRGWGQPGEYVSLVVTDTGQGMDDRTRQKVFEPFFTTKPVGHGTGLGMAMLYGLVKQLRGFVDLASEPGVGTAITVYFQLASTPVTHRALAPAPDEPQHGTETLLLAEDEAPIRRAAKRVLERFGYRVHLAADGLDALHQFRRRRSEIDLVISDVVMPRMGGRELYEAVQWEAPATRFLFTSGYSSKEKLSSTNLPMGGFIQKPWSVNDLLAKVREILDREPAAVAPGTEA